MKPIKKFAAMLESMESIVTDDLDRSILHTVMEAVYALYENDMFVEFNDVNGKMPSRSIPVLDDYTTNKTEILQDVVMYMYKLLDSDDISENDMEYILLNNSPSVTVNNVTVQLMEHPLWDSIREEAGRKLHEDPNYEGMRDKFNNKIISDTNSLTKLSKNADMSKINEFIDRKDTLKAAPRIGVNNRIYNTVKNRDAQESKFKSEKSDRLLDATKAKFSAEDAASQERLQKRNKEFELFMQKNLATA